jgi:trimeric autotransporter adhesin
VGAIPTPGLVVSSTINCRQSSVTLTASGGASYVFAGSGIVASSGSSATVNQAGSFSVTVTGVSGCTSTTATTVSSNTTVPAIGVSVSGPITCLSPSVTLVGSGGNTYAFAGPAVVPSGSNAGVVSASGVYSVTALFASSGCFSTTTVTVTGSATGTIPTVSLVGSGSAVCLGNSVIIAATVSGSASYGWYKDGQLVSNAAPPLVLGSVQLSQGGNYVLLVASSCGSATSTAFALTVKPEPTVVITFPASASVQMANGAPIVTVPPSGNLFYQLSGGVLYDRHVLIDRINGYLLRQYLQTTNGVFPIDQYGPYTIRVLGANNCFRIVEGEIRSR